MVPGLFSISSNKFQSAPHYGRFRIHSRTGVGAKNRNGVHLTQEEQLILLLVRGTMSQLVREQALALLATPLRWELILEHAINEEIYPLVNRNLRKLESTEHGAGSGEQGTSGKGQRAESNEPGISDGGLRIPKWPISGANEPREENGNLALPIIPKDEAREQLHKRYKINAFRNTLLTEELARVLRVLSDAGIPAITLKGPALAQALYGDPTLRSCVDLDILVPRSMVGRAFNLLRAKGYAGEFAPGFFADLLLRHDIEYGLRRSEHGFDYMVELHWGVSWGGKAEQTITDQLWADAYPTTVFGAPAYALSPEWQILFLAAHAARHQWQGLKWLVDLHELYSAPNVDWEKLDKKAKQLGWQELLRISFLACHSLFETPIPAKYLGGELPSWIKLFPQSAPAHLNGAFFATRLLQTRLDKLRYAARVLLIPTLAELRLVRLPKLLSFLYYPLRPVRLMCKWSWALLAKSKAQRGKSRSLDESASITIAG